MNTPNGTDINVANPVMISVPTMACQPRRPRSTTPRIDDVKNSTSIRFQPRCTTVHITETNGSSTRQNADVITAVASRSTAWRVPSTTRDTT